MPEYTFTHVQMPMRRKTRRSLVVLMAGIFSALMLLQGVMQAGIPVTQAANGMHVVYFPWVSQNEMIAGHSPWVSEFSIQNLTEIPCATSIFVARNGVWTKTAQLSLTPRAARSIGASSLGVPTPGAPVRFEAMCEMAIVVKQTVPRAMNPPWSDGAAMVTGYTGLGDRDIEVSRMGEGASWNLPIVQTNSAWNTFIRVTNFSPNEAIDVTVELYEHDNLNGALGADLILTRRLSVAESWQIDAAGVLDVSGWVGFAHITSTGPSGAIAHRMKPSSLMAITNVAVAADTAAPVGTYRTAAPLLFNAYNGWNTGINLANPTNHLAFVIVRYFAAGEAEMLREEEITIPARSMRYIYTPGNVEEEGFVGSALIVSSVPVVGAIDEVKYETTEALSYMASGVAQQDAAIPLVFRHDGEHGKNDNSGINIHNLKEDGNLWVRMTIFSAEGQPIGETPVDVFVPASGNTFVYLPFLPGLPEGTVASVRLTTQDPAGFVAISNDINYAAIGDGSVVFVAANSRGYYFVPSSSNAP